MNISKSKYMKGLQCPKLLWTICNAAESVPEADAGTQALFDEGTAVGVLAQSLFPDGVLVDRDEGFGKMLGETRSLLAERKPIFEASLSADGLYAQSDILNPVEDSKWDIVEVKMSTGVKPQHVQDVAFQRHCYECAGVPVRNCYLMHINNQYVRRGELDAHELLVSVNITEPVATESVGIADRIAEMHRLIGLQECPTVAMGSHCSNPYGCPLIGQCQAEATKAVEQNSSPAAPTGELEYNAEGIRNFLNQLVYPLYLLDFETFMRAIPPFDESWPYMKTPFQFSLHIVERLDAEPAHHSWLWDGSGDPRSLMLVKLRELIGDRGSVLAYFKSFEEGRIRESSNAFPEHLAWVQSLMPRMVDLIVPFRSHIVSHPAQNGSNSLKAVLPAITGTGYEDLEIQEGGTASAEFLRCIYGNLTAEENAKIRRNLEEYCGQDTGGMVEIISKLFEIIG